MPAFSFSASGLIGGVIFSAVGFVGFSYGKRTQNFRLMALGGALMGYPYFVSDTALIYLIGIGLTAALWMARE